ncbi:MAG: hypothetical protein AAF732_21275 [Pseudomonadota bacterium]
MTAVGSVREPPSGFAVGYAKGKGTFRVIITAVLAIMLTAATVSTGSNLAMILAAFFAVTSFYFFPLMETGRPRLGAGEYGIFIEGFGVLAWRSIANVRLTSRAIRTIVVKEIEIKLSRPMDEAVIADWRDLPYHRLLMRLPWRMPRDDTIIVDLEPFDGAPEQVVREIIRRWRYYG